MNLSFHIACRYLFSQKSHHAINLISMVSVLGVAAATLAMVCVLSVFNGFQDLISSLYQNFDPDLRITAVEGKTFHLYETLPDSISDGDSQHIVSLHDTFEQVRHHKAIAVCCESIEEYALARYKGSQTSALVKGVSDNFHQLSNIDSCLYAGEFKLEAYDIRFATLGVGLASTLSTGNSFIDPITLYAPKRRGNVNMANPAGSFKTARILPTATFGIGQPEYDDRYVIVPIAFARDLFDYDEDEVSSLELKIKKGFRSATVKKEIREILGPDYRVQDIQEQKADFYRINRVEKWITYLMLCFILLIALFNVIGSLSMLILEKKNDTRVLSHLGAEHKMLRSIFMDEGLLIALSGALLGILIGSILCLIQQHFGLIKLGNGGFIVSAYPVLIKAKDLLLVLITVLAVSIPSIWWPVHYVFGKDRS